MPLASEALGAALNEELTLHSTLCRREAGAFQQAIRSGDDVVVACTQEKHLFAELAAATEGGSVSPLKFVNIRETGGWGRDAAQAGPKIAALLAAAHLPEPDPVPTVTYRSAGRLLIVGPLDAAERAAALLADVLDVTIFSTGGQGSQARRFPVLAGQVAGLDGWLGAFTFRWSRNNPINLDLCTRCNACVAACPEGAIGLDYQVDLSLCQSHRACVKVCNAAGAIDFTRDVSAESEAFDLVLDMGAVPLMARHAPPQGYFRWDGQSLTELLRLREMVGEFDKPKFFQYKQKLCAHSRNTQVGCNACIDICSAEAVTSDKARQQIVVNPNLCVGCGACTTVCPTGALTYAYPRASHQGVKLKTLLATYQKAGGRAPVLLLHSQEAGQSLVEALGRSAQLAGPAPKRSLLGFGRRPGAGGLHGLPANVIPLPLWHSASTGIDLWLSAVAFGAEQVCVLVTPDDAPAYVAGLQAQMAIVQALLNGLGYAGTHFVLVQADNAEALDVALQSVKAAHPQVPKAPARHAVTAEKRSTLDLAIDHLVEHAPERVGSVLLPAGAPGTGSPFGAIEVNKDTCTLCLSCVSVCPANALQDNANAPQLRFIEKNCVQCGLCATTCPEDAITLVPRLLIGSARKETRVLNEMPPYQCVRCSKPFGTLKAIEGMLAKLAGHAMFQGAALERLKMCGDCRVIDLYSAQNETKITDL